MFINLQTLENATNIKNDELYSKFVDPINATLLMFQLNINKNRIAAFLAQILHESGNLRILSENLNYSSDALLKIFRTHFNEQEAKEYARHPEKIANRIYANRLGNGNESSGDGWKFRGRGSIQITGKSEYQNFANFMHKSLDEIVEYMETEKGAIISAGWFWYTRHLNQYADMGNIEKITRIIDGGLIGLSKREELYKKIMGLF